MASPIRREGMSRYRTITIAVLVVGGAVALLAGTSLDLPRAGNRFSTPMNSIGVKIATKYGTA